MEKLIQAIVNAMGIGASMEDIHDKAIAKGWSEWDFFLAYKGAELLYNDIAALEEEKKKKAVFRRVP